MHHQPWRATNAASSGLLPRTDGTCLPSQLIASVPSCAVKCIQAFVQSSYQDTACSSTSDLANLCTQSNTSGLTIGEGSVQCIISNCFGSDLQSLGVYNVCLGVPGALPNTATVIVATIRASTMAAPTTSTDLTSLPTSIGEPDTTQQITSLVMATGAPSVSTPVSPAATTQTLQDSSTSSELPPTSLSTATRTLSQTQTAPATKQSGNSAPVPDQASPSSSLDSSQVVGIALGASAVALITLAFIFFWCRHRKKAERKKNRRRSIYAHQTPPPKYDDPATDNSLLAPPSRNNNNGNHLSVYNPNRRYYAGIPEEKRRSFWRRSIRPEDIGLAISPKVNEQSSPTSIASHQSMLKLLPRVPNDIPGQSLWPAPLNVPDTRQRQFHSQRPISQGTVFDEDVEALAESATELLVAGTPFSLAPPPKARLSRAHATPLRLNPISREDNYGSPARKSYMRIPLTPTYDNGNVPGSSTKPLPPTTSRAGPVNPGPSTMEHSFLSEDDDRDTTPGSRKVLRKKSTGKMPVKLNPNLSPGSRSAPKPEPLRKDSETTAATEIEENSTPGEVEQRSEALHSLTIVPPPFSASGAPAPLQRSPISNLRYPTVPRSAAVSRQAELMPQPRRPTAGSTPTSLPRPKREELIRNNASFMVSDTTSSDGYLSDQSIDWPVPPMSRDPLSRATAANQSAFKANMIRLRENADGADRGVLKPRQGRSLLQVISSPTTSESRLKPQQLPRAAMLSAPEPVLSRGGDLYFTVEM